MTSSALQLAAIRWWRMHKPLHWSLDEHLANPTVNLRGQEAHELAEAIAAYVKKGKDK